MMLGMYTFFDTKSGLFSTPFLMRTDAEAIRGAQDLLADGNTMMSRHPADYVLFNVGTWDDNTARVEQRAPVNLGVLVSFIPQSPVNAGLPLFDPGADIPASRGNGEWHA